MFSPNPSNGRPPWLSLAQQQRIYEARSAGGAYAGPSVGTAAALSAWVTLAPVLMIVGIARGFSIATRTGPPTFAGPPVRMRTLIASALVLLVAESAILGIFHLAGIGRDAVLSVNLLLVAAWLSPIALYAYSAFRWRSFSSAPFVQFASPLVQYSYGVACVAALSATFHSAWNLAGITDGNQMRFLDLVTAGLFWIAILAVVRLLDPSRPAPMATSMIRPFDPQAPISRGGLIRPN